MIQISVQLTSHSGLAQVLSYPMFAGTHFTYPQWDGGLSQPPARLSQEQVLNPGPVAWQSVALPTELTWLKSEITSQSQTQNSDRATQWTKIGILGYADDHALKEKFHAGTIQEESIVTQGLEHCLENIKNWINSNRPKMNNDKTEVICFRSRQQLTKCITEEIYVIGTPVKRMDLIHYLGALMDTNLTFKNHTTHVCKKVMINLQCIKLTRVCLTTNTA